MDEKVKKLPGLFSFITEVQKFRENYKKKMKEAKIKFDAPKLLEVDFYHKHYSGGVSEGALNITFQIPKGMEICPLR